MKSIRYITMIASSLSLMFLAACGGSGSGSGSSSPTASTTVNGTVLAGPASGTTVTVKRADGTLVATSLHSGSDGSYSIAIPTSALSSDLIFEASGGTFPDEATTTSGIALGTFSAYAAAGSLSSGSHVTIDPSSTITQKLVAGGRSKAAAETAFAAAFGYTPDCSVKPAFATYSSASSTTQRLVGLRAAAFSQLTKDLDLSPDKQAELIQALADDLSDGTLDGEKSGVAVTMASGTAIPADIANRFVNALVTFQASPLNKCKLTADKIGTIPFAKTALTISYKVEYVPGAMVATQGKTSFKIKLTNRSDGTAATGKSITLKPLMYMATKNHTTPVDAVTEDSANPGTYSCTVYYLMSSSMNNMSMGFWKLAVLIGSEAANFYPDVAMPMGNTVLTKLTGITDSVMGEKRTYFLFNDGFSGSSGNYTFKLFVATKETMMNFPAVFVGNQLNDQSGTPWTVNGISVQVSTDGTTWVDSSDSGTGHWNASGLTGLSAGVAGKIYVKLIVNSEQKTTDGTTPAGANAYQAFTVTPGA